MRRLIADHIDSVEQLEILLLLYQHPERAWTAEAVARELRDLALSAGDRLEDLARGGAPGPGAGEPRRSTATPRSSPQLDEAVAGLADGVLASAG